MESRLFPLPWKRNLLKIPDRVARKIAGLARTDFHVACVRAIPESDIDAGLYRHVGLALADGAVRFSETLIPDPRVGHYSRVNREGKTIIRKDLPMEEETFVWQAPHYGDWHGARSFYVTRESYRREAIAPRGLALSIHHLATAWQGGRVFVFSFAVEGLLDRSADSFAADLLHGLNLLQENVGGADVFVGSPSAEGYAAAVEARLAGKWDGSPKAWRIAPALEAPAQ